MKTLITALALAIPVAHALSYANAARAAEPATATVSAMTEGEVRRIDKETKKLTLRHGPIQNLKMPGMTMVYQVKNAALLDKVRVGDKVRFAAESTDGIYFVTEIEALK